MKTTSNGKIRRSEDEWRGIVGEFEGSGLSQEKFCRRRGIATTSFYAWRNKLGKKEMPATRFVEVVAAQKSWDMELDLGCGVLLRIKR